MSLLFDLFVGTRIMGWCIDTIKNKRPL